MNAHKFTRKDWNMLAICGLLLLISVFYLGRNYRKAFPSYDIDFKLSRAESRLEAEKFLSRQNIDLNGFRHAVIFDYDELTKIFMEKEVGLEEASRLVNQDFPIWRWSNRWFKPLSREEFKVSLTTDGRIASFEHILPEEAAADAITIEAARKICRNFLFSDRQLNPEEWEFIEDKTDRKPNRVDYLFTYKKKGIEIFNATYRIDVGIQGDQIGKYHEYWKLPEQWLRGYQRMRSLNSTTALSANIFFLLILIAALITFSIHLSRKNVHFKTALWFGLATFILQFISQLNELPIQIYAFDTNQSLGNYYGDYFIQTFIVALLYGLLITVIAGAGESLYRRAYPDHIALPKAFTGAGIRTKSFLTNSICGFTLAVVFIAFQTCFYLIANHFGAWAPAEVTYSDVLNTYIPWIYVLLIGFTPAVTEEFSFRLFAIPFIGKITHSKLLAVLIPAIVWGFAHANYPNQPFWIRGAEVSLFGVFIGMIFMRFGILTVLVWHYTIDAIYTATFLVKTGQPYLVITASLAAGLIGLPILYNLVSYLRTRKFSETNSLVNDATGLTPEPTTIETEVKPTPPEIADYQSHPSGKVRNGLILSAVFLMVLLLPANKIGEFYHFPIAKNEIRRTAADYLADKHINPDEFETALGLVRNYDPLMGRYIIQFASVQQLNLIMAQFLPDLVTWEVRFFKPGEREEYRLQVNPMDNRVVAFDHLLDEDAPGANLTKATAQTRAAEFLVAHQYDLTTFRLAESDSKAQPNRTDYQFIWESLENHPASLEEGRLRLKVSVRGDEIAAFATSYKIPKKWEDEQTRRTTLQSAVVGLQIVLLILIIYRIVILLLRKRQTFFGAWRPVFRIALGISALAIVASLLYRPAALLNYDTSWSLNNWNFLWLMLIVLKAIGVALIAALMLVTINVLYPQAEQSLRKSTRPQYARDALLAALVITTGLLACGRITNLIAGLINPAMLADHFPIYGLEDSIFPLVNGIFDVILKGLIAIGMIAIGGFLLQNLLARDWARFSTIIILTAIFTPHNYLSLSGYIAGFLRLLLPALWLFIGLRYFVGANPPAFLYGAIGFFTITNLIDLLSAGSPGGRAAAVLLIIIAVILILWIVTEKLDLNLKYLVKRYLK